MHWQSKLKMRSLGVRELRKRMKLSVQIKMRLLLLAILVAGGVVSCLFCWLFSKFQWWMSLVIVLFAVWLAFAGWVSEHSKGRVMKVISYVVSAPVAIGFLAIALVQPFITIIGTYFL